MFRQARFYIYPTEGKVRGQALTDLGEKKFQPILEWIAETDTEIILFCIKRLADCYQLDCICVEPPSSKPFICFR